MRRDGHGLPPRRSWIRKDARRELQRSWIAKEGRKYAQGDHWRSRTRHAARLERCSPNECYKLDSFGQGDCVGKIFESEIGTVILGIFKGRNATVIEYGATGSGKTYTMQGTEGEPVLILLAMSDIFSLFENAPCSVEVVYYEVYMDRCYDLLEPKEKEIMTLHDHEGNLQLKGLSLAVERGAGSDGHKITCVIKHRLGDLFYHPVNADNMGAELLDTLLKMAPTKEDGLKLKEHKGTRH